MIERELVESAKVLGQLINRAAYTIADSKVKCFNCEKEREREINVEKSKTLNRFENTIMQVKTPQDMIFRVSSFIGRNLASDLPIQANSLMEETLVGEKLRLKDAVFLLVGFMRQTFDEHTDEKIQ